MDLKLTNFTYVSIIFKQTTSYLPDMNISKWNSQSQMIKFY